MSAYKYGELAAKRKSSRTNLEAIAEVSGLSMLEVVDLYDAELFPTEVTHTTHFQHYLPTLLLATNPLILIETGMDHGVSTAYILSTFESAPLNHDFPELTTIELAGDSHKMVDILEEWGFKGSKVEQDNVLTFVPASRSFTWIPVGGLTSEEYLNSVPDFMTDFFLHDSDHGYECQSFEYAWAWEHLTPGGLLISDDYTWRTHNEDGSFIDGKAWSEFVAAHQVTWYTIGNAAMCQKV